MGIESVMQTKLVSVNENDSMTTGIKKIRENKIKHLPVLGDDGKLAGIVTDRDLKRASASDATTLEIHELLYILDQVKMKEIMTRNPITATPAATVGEAAGLLARHSVGCLPILEDGKMVGLVTRTDILRYVAESEKG